MEQTINSDLQFKQSTDFSGLGETNMLANAYLLEPEKMESVIAQSMGHSGINIFEYLTGGVGAVKKIDGNEYRWDIYTKDNSIATVQIQSPEYVNDASEPGYAGTTFQIILDKNWYGENDILVADDAETRIKVLNSGVMDGSFVKYTCVLHSSSFDASVPVDFLAPGAQWSKDYTLVGEESMRGGGDVYRTPYGMENRLGIYRKTITCTRSAAGAVMVMELPNPQDPSKKTKLWTTHQELVMMQNWYAEKDNVMMFSTYSKNQDGMNPEKAGANLMASEGAGFRQQIAKSNIQYFSGKITYAIIADFFTMLSFKINEWGGDAEFILLTGRKGMDDFHDAIKDEVAERNIVLNDANFLTFSGNNIALKGYYDTVFLRDGTKVTVKHFPAYDNTERFRKKHPITGYPVESYRYTILNMGSKNGKANVRKVVKKNGENLMWSVYGSFNPISKIGLKGGSSSTGRDGYEKHLLDHFGVQIQDPTTCGELILRV